MLRIWEEAGEGGRTVLRLEGEVKGQGVEEVARECERRLGAAHALELDLGDVVFVDRAGIGLLRDLVKRNVAIANCSPFLTEQLKEI